jgi:peptidyl-prolyl cis-trans isomerase A (cyclophilin A)
MFHRLLAAALLTVLAVPALAQAPAAPAPAAPAPKEDLVPVAIETDLGRIVVALDRGHAPVTVANFLHYVDTHRYDGQVFYRAMHVPDQNGADGGLIQGGITTDARKLYAPIAHEATTQTGLRNVAGAISLANAGPGTGRADFFILLSNMPGLDAGGPGGDPNGFAAFGHVTEGMDVVRKIWSAPVSATKGSGVMKGQMLDPVVKIIRVVRVSLPAASRAFSTASRCADRWRDPSLLASSRARFLSPRRWPR